MKKQYLAACALTALSMGLATPAAAQDTAPANTTPATASGTENAAVTPQAQTADDNIGGEVVVTAQGRAQVLADVPVAVSAVSAASLQNSGANDIRQLNQLAPSLLVSSTGSEANGSARIRGIGTVGDNPGLESSVAVFIDGVYRSRSGIGLNELGEIDRVEVLRGPQGTLGGRNSSAGLISVISKKPSFSGFSGGAEATYGNYDAYRLSGNVNVPFGETVAARIDGVYSKRQGFYYDPTNDVHVNNRDRYFVRGQLRFQPNSDLEIRLIADYTHRNEACCGATYVDRTVNNFVGDLNELATPLSVGGLPPANGNNIVNVLRDLGQPVALVNRAGYDRTLSVSPGRSYDALTRDYGFSGQIDYNLGGVKLTSITAYRDYKAEANGDTDYSTVDLLYRPANGGSYRQFKTFTQELRLNGEAFGGHLDWLVGGFYSNEDLIVHDQLLFGSQYGRFATCRIISGGGLAGLYSPGSAGCVSSQAVFQGAFAAAGPVNSAAILASLLRLDGISNVGSTGDRYKQNSENYALFTHNIIHVLKNVDLTLGARYTHERKKFDASFGSNNTACTANQAAIGGLVGVPSLAAVTGGIIGLSCVFNSTTELNGVSINDARKEHKFTGTAILSWKPTDDLLTYASYSRGYKAGGFNLDRSALKPQVPTFASVGGAQALVGNLQFAPETVNAFEVGAKYATGPFSLSAAVFRQDFSNFQLNTFNGTVFLVQNINGCNADLAGGDRDLSAATGACATGDVGHGVRSEGVELEAQLVPMRNLRITAGATLIDTSYRSNLVGTAAGTPLDPALRVLPGKRLSNAPATVVTASAAWTPDIGSSGLSGLVYVDTRMSSDYNTGSDLFPQKGQDGFALFNARVGVRGRDQVWAVEFWGQNIFNKQYAQVGFSSPFQAGTTSAPFVDPQYPGGRQIFSQFLAEPRTYGVTLRGKF